MNCERDPHQCLRSPRYIPLLDYRATRRSWQLLNIISSIVRFIAFRKDLRVHVSGFWSPTFRDIAGHINIFTLFFTRRADLWRSIHICYISILPLLPPFKKRLLKKTYEYYIESGLLSLSSSR